MIRRTAIFGCLWMAGIPLGARAQDADFRPLFNGKDLTGWQMKSKRGPGYVVENGVLVCPAQGGGNLFTNEQFANFILELDFKLTPGGNNGVGLRAPLGGDAAYSGMEIQILDDPAPQYRTLKPYQYCGSLYGVAPAKRGALKPAGEWNHYRILCDKRRVQVTLNGQVVVDINLDEVTDPEVVKSHPGLQRQAGHIGLLGHGTRTEFRDLKIQVLP